MMNEEVMEPKKSVGRGGSGLAGRLFEMGLAAAVMAVVVMMIVPLVPWLLDLLISLNLALAVLVLSLALFIRRPLSFTAFPTLLMVATLYRLALNVSSTRLILLRADAGRIIGGFGGYVVGGDILVGAVIFAILAMVLFLVITKGAERVAEVAARFTLDALPGMQLAIDADLRAGALTAAEASRRRERLDRRSRYYGALDGAMKFVRGDAVAALVIVAVNIAGGLAVGILRRGLSIGEALDLYGRLTVGDGLVTLIPALLVSTAAGLLVTRVGEGDGEGRPGRQLGRQLFAEPRALSVAAVLMACLAAVPGLPAWPFVLLAAGLGAAAYVRFGRERREATPGDGDLEEEAVVQVAPASVRLGAELRRELADGARRLGGWRRVGWRAAGTLRDELGLPIGAVGIGGEAPAAGDRGLEVRVRGALVYRGAVPPACRYTGASRERLAGIGVEVAEPGVAGCWFAEDRSSYVTAAGLEESPPLEGVLFEVGAVLRSRIEQLVGLDETQLLVDRVASARPVLVRETVPKLIGVPALAELLGRLAREGLSLEHLPAVLEVVSRVRVAANPEDLLAEVRRGLAPLITAELLDGDADLEAIVLGGEVEDVLAHGMSETDHGRRLALPEEASCEIVEALRGAVAEMERPLLIVRPDLRRPLAEVLAADLPGLKVVAHGELEARVPVRVKTTVDI